MEFEQLHLFSAAEYLGMSGKSAEKFSEVFIMGNNCFGGNGCWWIIILVLLFCCCGNGNGITQGNNCNCGCDNNCCC